MVLNCRNNFEKGDDYILEPSLYTFTYVLCRVLCIRRDSNGR